MFSDLSKTHKMKYPTKETNVCLSLIHRSYTNDCPAYSSGYCENDKTRDFAYILKRSPAFVDKTHRIKSLFESGYPGLLTTAPRHFGKSVNLSMLKYFFEIEVSRETGDPITKANIQSEPVTDTYNYKLFRDLAVYQHPEFVEEHLGRYPVILLDFSLKTSIDSYEDAFNHCQAVVCVAYKQHSYLVNSTKLNHSDKEYCRSWCCDTEFQKSKPSGSCSNALATAVVKLKEMLHKHFDRKCVFLVDEYDAMFRAALVNTDQRMFKRCKALQEWIIDYPLISDGKFENIALGVLTGVSYMATYGTKDLNRLLTYQFLHYPDENWYDEYSDSHGFTQQEFDLLMDVHNISDDLRQQATQYYNGYCSLDGEKKFYNPSSIARFLETKIIQVYWSNSEFFDKYRFLLNDNEIDVSIKLLIFGQTVDFDCHLLGGHILPACCLHRILDDENSAERSTYFMSFLFEHGYLKTVEHREVIDGDRIVVKLANEEIRITLLEELKKYYKTSGKFDWQSMATCAQHFDHINTVITGGKVSAEDVGNIYTSMEKYCSAFFATNRNDIRAHRSRWSKYDGVFEEQYLRRLIYNVASLTNYKVVMNDPQKYKEIDTNPCASCASIRKTAPDIKMCADHCCILIQVKYNSTSEKVLNQLIRYPHRDGTTKHALIGVNLDKKLRLSLSAEIGGKFYAFAETIPSPKSTVSRKRKSKS